MDGGGQPEQARGSGGETRKRGRDAPEPEPNKMHTEKKPAHGAASNGAAAAAATSSPGATVGTRSLIPRSEYVRLLQDALARLGHTALAKQLETESGVPLCSAEAASLRAAVLAGRWADAAAALAALPAADAGAAPTARRLLRRHQLRELLETDDVAGALAVLRRELRTGPRAALHAAAAMLLCPDTASLAKAAAAADEADAAPAAPAAALTARAGSDVARAALLARLTDLLHPSAAVPEGRLETLLEQAAAAQIAACTYHNSCDAASCTDTSHAHHHMPGAFSLLRDHACGPDALPTRCAAVLEAHSDEVWHCAFSHDGGSLASGAKDATVAIHAIALEPHAGVTATRTHLLRGHVGAVTHVSWSPDDTLLLSCSADRCARLWHAASGACVRVLARHADALTAAAWAPDGRGVFTAGLDKRIALWDVPIAAATSPGGGGAQAAAQAAAERRAWRVPRCNDCALSGDGRVLAAVCAERRVRLWRASDGAERWLTAAGPVTSLALSYDATSLLLCMQSQEVHLWDLSTLDFDAAQSGTTTADPATSDGGPGAPSAPPCATLPALVFRGQGGRAGRYVVRATFGGAAQAFVASGAEDSQVYLWRRATGRLLAVLPGHAGVVNAVAWSEARPGLIASASDDRTLRLWASETLLAQLAAGQA